MMWNKELQRRVGGITLLTVMILVVTKLYSGAKTLNEYLAYIIITLIGLVLFKTAKVPKKRNPGKRKLNKASSKTSNLLSPCKFGQGYCKIN